MTNIKCGWMLCTHNNSSKPGVPGECMAEEVELKHVDEYLEEDDITLEFLECLNFNPKE